ncbi:response regulator [Clostridium tetani]|uniref:response regulator n=1 Tax=Clostridium tetani TaxID=1513 RepID=UPI000E12302F|nr:response regulator [Clostridium tetani]WFN61033.1 response regulator [Clostridium tetani]SUY56254.1 response regulator [Clostridium tetani]BDR64686.1 response regulator [Clostridium tetani]BDR70092.1 response regulator [Clostridium tetani]BDR72867.1 response regulator [Clostridium tetani]
MYTVVHIEQSEFFSNIIKVMLEEQGYEYINTDNFSEACYIIENNDVDLIITSLLAKGGSIEEFIKDINSSDKKEIPIFVVTGDNINEKKKSLFNLGISDYILKEDLQEEISKHVQAVLEEDGYMRDLREAKIAIVEDSSLEYAIVRDILKNYGIENLELYKTGKELIDSNKTYDIYLIDLVLQNEYGKNIIRQIRRNNIKATIIAITSLSNSKTLSSILGAGADDFILKPVDKGLFIAKLKSNIRIYSLNKKINTYFREIEIKNKGTVK